MRPETLIWLIPLPPILSFFFIVLGGCRSNRLSHTVAVGSMLVSWALAMIVFWQAINVEHLGQHPFASSIAWMPMAGQTLNIGILVDPLGALSLFFVAWTCLAIFLYSIGYHNFGIRRDPEDRPGLPPKAGGIEPMYARFFAFISLFAFGMLVLVLSDDLLILFVGWEIMGLCSYLLIGFWYGKDSAKQAMVKAFMTTRVGDVFMLLGLVYLYSATGTLNFREILYNDNVLQHLAGSPSLIAGLSTAGLIGLLLFMGTVGKSAQWPLHVWLPDAMEGPTPVSAMIHAATMVSAGVYLILRFFPLITAGWQVGAPLTPTMSVIAIIGAFTALFSATIAVAQNDIKRVLAYSTISQLGYMVAAVGICAYVAAAFHLITHAFFKALLFLGSGSVIHGVEHGVRATDKHVDAQDMFNMGGLRTKMPVTFLTFTIGGLALSGFPLITAGFWSKDEILGSAFGSGQVGIFVVLVLAALLTGFYTARQITLTFLGEARSEASGHAHESVWTMTLPLMLLAVFAVAGGWVGIGSDFPLLGGLLPNWMHEFVGGSLLHEVSATHFHPVPLMASIVAGVGGLFLGWLVYRRIPQGSPDPLARALGPVHKWMRNKYYFDELYQLIFVRPAYWFAETFTYLWVDRRLIDGFLNGVAAFSLQIGSFLRSRIDLPVVNGSGDLVGEGVKRIGRDFRPVQSGRVQAYLMVGLVFAGLLLSYMLVLRP
jgi:NADH-quinone oxidoreductase subunit L